MRLIVVKDFEGVTDAVKTEETIWENLEKDHELISDEYVFVKIPLAFTINSHGLPAAQHFINSVNSQYPNEKLVFICQHIQVKLLSFPAASLVFTPHATTSDDFFPLPHYSPLPPPPLKTTDSRPVKLSFQGSFSTHVSRRTIYSLWGKDPEFFIQDTGLWHFEQDPQAQIESKESYINLLKDSSFSLCPRGTGPSTIRIWEALSYGSIPIIISDGLKLPLPELVEWENCALFISESNLHAIKDSIPQDPDTLKKMQDYGRSIYSRYFNNCNLHQSITIPTQLS